MFKVFRCSCLAADANVLVKILLVLTSSLPIILVFGTAYKNVAGVSWSQVRGPSCEASSWVGAVLIWVHACQSSGSAGTARSSMALCLPGASLHPVHDNIKADFVGWPQNVQPAAGQ